MRKCANAQVCNYLRKYTSMLECASEQVRNYFHKCMHKYLRKYESKPLSNSASAQMRISAQKPTCESKKK